MELSGEIISGQFFEDIPGIQFISPAALLILKKGLPEDVVYRVNAIDPASLCTIAIPALQNRLPRRIPGNHLFYHGTELVMIARRNGTQLECFFSPDSPHVSRYLDLLKELKSRAVNKIFPVLVATINGKPVFSSEYLPGFLKEGFVSGYRQIYYVG